ncbi:MAG TPA: ABC transporter permease subunit [Candidatus Limnocylindria bacterium]|nr:ABC transporter permease subunit [Candidatus Limnocylindria bacterium]
MTSAETTSSPVSNEPISTPPSSGWLVVAGKEFADQLLSLRFIVLFVILGLAAALPLFIAAEQIRSLAEDVSGLQAVFIAMFIIGPPDFAIFGLDFTVAAFVGLTAPLLGIAFAFDAVNGERAQGTLPRLVSQPIHRDAVINGKFGAALVTISLVLISVVLMIGGFGLLRLGVVPTGSELLRLIAWVALTLVYVAMWLAFGTLLSVVFKRAATAALVGFGVWLLVALFGRFLLNLALAIVVPIDTTLPAAEQLASYQWHALLNRLLPPTLYTEASTVLLNPSVTQTSVPATLGELDQAQQQIPTLLSLDQSLLLVWPHVVVLVAITVACFAYAYIRFMREEVRA